MKRKPINQKTEFGFPYRTGGGDAFLNRFGRCFFALLLAVLCAVPILSAPEKDWLKNEYRKGDFKLVFQNRSAGILISPADFKVTEIAARDLATDVERVTGIRPKVSAGAEELSENVVIIGTLGKNALIENLIKSGKLDVSEIQDKWESFLITTIENPLPNVKTALVITGSDRRGTAFGVYELSQKIGVSPWVWWADVAPEPRKNLIISRGTKRGGEPSVRYRGIFLNDEDWGLQPWAAKTFEPETGDVGPKTYAKIFELLLRLKANTIWPAMHEVTKPFNELAANRQTADDYAIVMGSSHAEPMLRNNVGEWKDAKEKYNFVINPEGVANYWEERVKTNARFENVYTLGMRGIHDSPVQGTKNQAERIPLLEKIIATQRSLLSRYIDKNLAEIPQIFCPYKEVLIDYRAGLQVPEDVTIVFPDDNFGYIRAFPDAEEQNRKGGFGVYYHISYLGRPLSYLWLNSTPPALIWEEMSKAFDHRMRAFWMLNVGDLKPSEIGTEFFMQMAWDARRWRRENFNEYLKDWARREFGAKRAGEIASIMDDYYKLGFQRKPEHLQWYLPNESPQKSDFSAVNYGDEIERRFNAYESLKTRAGRLYETVPAAKKDAFYQLVLYPVRSAVLANERFFAVEKSMLYFQQGRASAKSEARRATEADAQIKTETAYFNEKLAGGKWRGMMSPEMNKGQWPSMRSTPPAVPDAVWQMEIPDRAALGVAVEGREKSLEENERAVLPALDVFTKEARFIDVFNQGASNESWTAAADRNWIKLSQTKGELRADTRIRVSIDWRKAPMETEISGEIEIKTVTESRKIKVPVFNPPRPRPENLQGFVESGGVVSIEAEHFTGRVEKQGAGWQIIQGLGRTGDSVAVFPTNAESFRFENILSQSPALEYQFYSFTGSEFEASCFLVPTQPLRTESAGLRYAISIDDQAPQIVTVGADAEVSSPVWARNVLNASTVGKSKIKINPGAHVLKIFMVDAGVVLDKIVLSAGAMPQSYLGRPETVVR